MRQSLQIGPCSRSTNQLDKHYNLMIQLSVGIIPLSNLCSLTSRSRSYRNPQSNLCMHLMMRQSISHPDKFLSLKKEQMKRNTTPQDMQHMMWILLRPDMFLKYNLSSYLHQKKMYNILMDMMSNLKILYCL